MKRSPDIPPDGATVVVLGARIYETRLSPTLQNRVQAAADYLLAHPQSMCITTGGRGADESRSEGEAAKKALTALGVESGRITAETRSTTTMENLRFAKEILVRSHRGTAVLIATQRYHMWRACAMARQLGLAPYPLFAGDRLRALPKNACRELLAIVKFLLLRGRA